MHYCNDSQLPARSTEESIDLVSRLPGGFAFPVSPRTAPFLGRGLRGGTFRVAACGGGSYKRMANLQELSLDA
jgi:hypothetical protein